MIIDVQLPFGSMVALILKFWLASLVAWLVLLLPVAIVYVLILAAFGP